MAEVGILKEAPRVELVDGRIIDMSPIGPRHAACAIRLAKLFITSLGDRTTVSIQAPMLAGDDSEPEPDVVLLEPRSDFYAEARPTTANALLLIEVADSSLRFDRMVKLPIYAAGGIAEFWIVNLEGEVIEVHREPTGDTYAARRVATRGESITPLAFPDLVVAVSDVLG
jgi:Uma2 family endonuclease